MGTATSLSGAQVRRLTLITLLAALLAGCQHSPSKDYFVLTGPDAEAAGSTAITQMIGLGPVTVADYLDRASMLVQAGDGSLRRLPNSYWGEPLDQGTARVLALNLAARDAGRSFVYFPWRADSRPSVSLRVQLLSLNWRDGQARLDASWELVDGQTRAVRERRRFVHRIDAQGGPRSLAQAYSQLLALLAADMDAALTRHVHTGG